MKNGMILFVADSIIPGPKLLDIEITNTFPLIDLEEKAFWIKANGRCKDISKYDHISIPPDLRLHISSKGKRLFFNVRPVWDLIDSDDNTPIHYFTFVGLPRNRIKPLVEEGKTRTWHQALIVSPFLDKESNPSSRLFIDFFLHKQPTDKEYFENFGFCMPKMRLAADRNGSILPSFSFSSLQRSGGDKYNGLLFTIRFGYIEMDNTEAVYFYTPLAEFKGDSLFSKAKKVLKLY